MAFYDIANLEPEIHQWNLPLTVYSLTELKKVEPKTVKRTEDAINEGHLMLREHKKKFDYAISSLWIHKNDLDAFEQLKQQIEAQRLKDQQKKERFFEVIERIGKENQLLSYKKQMLQYALDHFDTEQDIDEGDIIDLFKAKKEQKNQEKQQKRAYIRNFKQSIKSYSFDKLINEGEHSTIIDHFFRQKFNTINFNPARTQEQLYEQTKSNFKNFKHEFVKQQALEKAKIAATFLEADDMLIVHLKTLYDQPALVQALTQKALDDYDHFCELEPEHCLKEHLGNKREKQLEKCKTLYNKKVAENKAKDLFNHYTHDIDIDFNDFQYANKQIASNNNLKRFNGLINRYNLNHQKKVVSFIFRSLFNEVSNNKDWHHKIIRFFLGQNAYLYKSKSKKFSVGYTVKTEKRTLKVRLEGLGSNKQFADRLNNLETVIQLKQQQDEEPFDERLKRAFQSLIERIVSDNNATLEVLQKPEIMFFKTELKNDVFFDKNQKTFLFSKPFISDIINRHDNYVKETFIEQKIHELKEFKELYPKARSKQRHFIFYEGPTNSGKTYHAFNQLSSCHNGIYLAPLRLLALEGQQELENRGVNASYLTGEESNIVPDSQFMCSTIEMLNFNKEYECAVIDEIQMLGDRQRGTHWLEAMVGVNADTVILTGSESARELVKQIVDYTQDTLEIVPLERKTELKALSKPVKIANIDNQSAIIVFSKKEAHRIQSKLKKPASIIYGSLSPQARKEQARQFRERETNVLIATDAIGMGLNLPIKNIYFSTLKKFDGEQFRFINSQELLQISGRAGRYGIFDKGTVGFVDTGHEYQDRMEINQFVKKIQQRINEGKTTTLSKCYLSINKNTIYNLKELFQEDNIFNIMSIFDDHFYKKVPDFVSGKTTLQHNAVKNELGTYRKIIETLPFEDKIELFFLPLSFDTPKKDDISHNIIKQLLKALKGESFSLVKSLTNKQLDNISPNLQGIEKLENEMYKLDLLHAINNKFPELVFIKKDIDTLRKTYSDKMSQIIQASDFHKSCHLCGEPISVRSVHNYCEDCFL